MKIREQKSAEGLMVEMLHGAAVGQEGRLSLLCSARLRRGRLAARVLTRFNLSPRSPPPHPSCPNPLTGALKLSPPLSPLPLSPPSSPSFGRPDRRWPFPGRRWACTLKRSCRRCFQARTSPKPQKPSLRMRRSGRRKRRTQRTTSYSRDANGWKRTRRSSTSNSDWMRSEDCLPRLPFLQEEENFSENLVHPMVAFGRTLICNIVQMLKLDSICSSELWVVFFLCVCRIMWSFPSIPYLFAVSYAWRWSWLSLCMALEMFCK